MAVNLVVEYPSLQASVKIQGVSLTVESAESNSPTLQASILDPSLDIGASVVAPISGELLNFIKPNLTITSLRLFADIVADPDPKNLYFTKGNPNAVIVDMLEQLAYSVNKPFTDSFSLTDSQVFNTNKGLSDTATMLDSVEVLLEFLRNFSDSYSVTDQQSLLLSKSFADDNFSFSDDHLFDINKRIQHSVLVFENANFATGKNISNNLGILEESVFGLDLIKSDDVSINEENTKDFELSKAETLGISEGSVLLFDKGQADSVVISESFNRTVSFNRFFSDAFTLDDIASISDPLQTDISSEKTNVAFLSEDNIFALTKPLQDTTGITEQSAYVLDKSFQENLSLSEAVSQFNNIGKTDILSISDQDVISFDKSINDSLAISESISLKVIVSSKSVLNTAALNTSALN